MPLNVEMTIYALSVFLLPLVVYSLLTGSKAPKGSWMSKYYEAEKYLGLAGNLFLLTIIANSMMRLAEHFGLVGSTLGSAFGVWSGVPFAVLWFVYVGLWVRAYRKLRPAA